ncbi:DNA topoisomerase III, partial [Nematocida sp. AWRm77]
LQEEARGCAMLIIWTDCDREGENIGDQISSLLEGQIKTTRRARFSGLGSYEIKRAVENLCMLNLHESRAVLSRFEIDLRIGAALTRLQTLGLQGLFEERKVLSYGSCQIPTLGFVCEREDAMENFVEEKKWTLSVEGSTKESGQKCTGRSASPSVFSWSRGYIFVEEYVSLKHAHIQGHALVVTKSEKKTVFKRKPVPLRTVELQKFFSQRKGSAITSHELMKIAESLYTSGYISYPRTETDAFPDNFNYKEPLHRLGRDSVLGEYARTLVPAKPSRGRHSDQAHTPIYPMKDGGALKGKDRAVYEYIARRFLACYSHNAEGVEETVECTVNGEVFVRKALEVTKENYLKIYIYEKWGDAQKSLDAKVGDVLEWVSSIKEGCTEKPSLLTEAELIAKMDANGIGTDATIHDHIQKIKEREYIQIHNGNRLASTWIGKGLIRGYKEAGLSIHQPHLRKEFEASLKKIERQETLPGTVVEEQITLYRGIYADIEKSLPKFKEAFSYHKSTSPPPPPSHAPAHADVPSRPYLHKTPSTSSFPNRKVIKTSKEGGSGSGSGNGSGGRGGGGDRFGKENLGGLEMRQVPAQSPQSLGVMCNCKIEANEQTVKKEGPNKGKQFYACMSKQCDFFQWKIPPHTRTSPQAHTRTSPQATISRASDILSRSKSTLSASSGTDLCLCGLAPKRLVSKTPANNNRVFFKCSKSSNQCSFFQWEDEK